MTKTMINKTISGVKLCSITLLTIGLLLVASACGGKKQDASAAQGAAVPEIAVITIGEEQAALETGYPATLHGSNDVEIRPQVSGFLTEVLVGEGSRVSKGQTLFVIDGVQLQAAVDAAQQAVNVAQANVNTAQTNADNDKALLDKNIISASAYRTSANALAAAKASLAQAQANLVSARKNLSYSNVTSPIAGVVGTIDYKVGALVSQQNVLTIVSDNNDIEAWFSLNEKEILQLTGNGTGSLTNAIENLPPVYLKLANGERYADPGKIVSISGVLDPATGSATVKARFPNPKGVLHSGNTGQVLIPDIRNNAIVIPQKATYEIQDMKFVYIVNDSNKVYSQPIEISNLDDGQNYIVTSGLSTGDVVVVEGVGQAVKDGVTIKPKR